MIDNYARASLAVDHIFVERGVNLAYGDREKTGTMKKTRDRGAGRFGLASCFALCLAVSGARAETVEGLWTRDDGAARVQISPCGEALCGVVVWMKSASAKARVGQRVFFDMIRADQNSWAGKAFNPEDGKTYNGKMVLNGRKLKTSGCVLGGLICKTVLWKRGD